MTATETATETTTDRTRNAWLAAEIKRRSRGVVEHPPGWGVHHASCDCPDCRWDGEGAP